MMMQVQSIILTMAIIGGTSGHWSYTGDTGPANWPDQCTQGQSQSPIDIVTSEAKQVGKNKALYFWHYGSQLKGSFVNNGHSMQFNPGKPSKLILTGGTLDKGEKYRFEQLHFHWGS